MRFAGVVRDPDATGTEAACSPRYSADNFRAASIKLWSIEARVDRFEYRLDQWHDYEIKIAPTTKTLSSSKAVQD